MKRGVIETFYSVLTGEKITYRGKLKIKDWLTIGPGRAIFAMVSSRTIINCAAAMTSRESPRPTVAVAFALGEM